MAARQRDLRQSTSVEIDARIAHSSPGRLRLRLDRKDFESSAAAEAADAFRALDHVLESQLNPLARSLVVHYDERATDAESLIDDLVNVGVQVRLDPPDPASGGADGVPPLSATITGVAQRADEKVLAVSGGSADLRTLLPVTLAALAAREIFSGRATNVPWYALAWYAFDSFAKLRRGSNVDPGIR